MSISAASIGLCSRNPEEIKHKKVEAPSLRMVPQLFSILIEDEYTPVQISGKSSPEDVRYHHQGGFS